MKTKGAKSYVGVPLSELNRLFNPQMLIPVSTAFCEGASVAERRDVAETCRER
jgi:hypothetical protein